MREVQREVPLIVISSRVRDRGKNTPLREKSLSVDERFHKPSASKLVPCGTKTIFEELETFFSFNPVVFAVIFLIAV